MYVYNGKGVLMEKEQILYEDRDIIVCRKPAGIATQSAKMGQRDMFSEVSNYCGMPIKLIHRLDQPVEGILVFAKSRKAAAGLSREIADGSMEKYYYAVVSMDASLAGAGCSDNHFVNTGCENSVSAHGDLKERKGSSEKPGTKEADIAAMDVESEITLINYLYKDNKSNTSAVVTKEHEGAKRAELRYRIRQKFSVRQFCEKHGSGVADSGDGNRGISVSDYEDVDIALLDIKLITGRHHQIRVQMAAAGMALLGDCKYADERSRKLSALLGQTQIALCAYKLSFNHPVTGKKLSFCKVPEGRIFQNFSIINKL